MGKTEKNKKPFFLRWWFIILVIIIVGCVATDKNGTDRVHDDIEEIDWSSDIELSEMLPEPDSNEVEIITNSDDSMYIRFYDISMSEYRSYLNKCEDEGYVLEADKSTNSYRAFNEEGWNLYVLYDESDEEMLIDLDAPMEMNEIEWPESEVAQLLPIPESTIGRFSTDTSDRLFVYIGETSIEDYNKYVKKCSENGFSVDYDKGEKYYNAEDSKGNELSLDYIGGNVMTIEISKSENINDSNEDDESTDKNDSKVENTTNTSEPKKTETTNTVQDNSEEKSNLVNGMRPEFKEAMDSYENFMDEYCKFMKKYTASNGQDLSLLADYSSYISKYAEFVEDFGKWSSDGEMNNTELTYYIDVQTRVNKKLLEISG